MVWSIAFRWLLACLGALVAMACSGDADPTGSANPLPSADIVGTPAGIADRQHDPAVVALVVDGNVVCSGALIGPDVVLTARHCVTDDGAMPSCSIDAGTTPSPRDPASLQVLVGDSATGGGLRGPGREVIAPTDTNSCGADIALVILSEPLDGTRPLKVRPTGAARGDHVRTSGFVVADAGAVKVVRDHVYIEGTTRSELRLEEACWAMAGSPALDEGTGAVVGVESRAVGSACSGAHAQNAYARTDTYFDFISHALAHAAGASTSTGQAKEIVGPVDLGSNCVSASDCAAGVCVSVADRQYCSRMCGSHDRCPSKYRCLGTSEGTSVCVD